MGEKARPPAYRAGARVRPVRDVLGIPADLPEG